MTRRVSLLALLMCVFLESTHCAVRLCAQIPDTITIDSGNIRGAVLDEQTGLQFFGGIPYAAPPVGNLRWRPPGQVDSWQGIRKCTQFGPDCWQRSTDPKAIMSEDCLSLNVWTTNIQGKIRFPVMVWIHGGGLNSGSSSRSIYSGSKLALHEIVVVSVNYRLGRLGYLAHPDLSKESQHNISGNYGFLDQIQALKWVQENISQFGGDANNVTVFGESAGGTSIAVLASSPLARGLFHRAIIQSAWMFGYSDAIALPCILPLRKPAGNFSTTEQEGQQFASQAVNAIGAKAIARLRALSVKELYEAKADYRQRVTIDGFVLPDHPEAVFAAGRQIDVPMFIGNCEYEGNFFLQSFQADTYQAMAKELAHFYGNQAMSTALLFKLDDNFPAAYAQSWFVTDVWFNRPARALVHGMLQASIKSPVFKYRFSRPSRTYPSLGAPHALDNYYVFGTLGKNNSAEDKKFSRQIREYWTTFARTGNPRPKNLPAAPVYNLRERSFIDFGETITIKQKWREDFLDSLDELNRQAYKPAR